MLENRDSQGGLFLFKSIEFLTTKKSKINPKETIVEFQVDGKTFETSVNANNDEAISILKKAFSAGKTIPCTFYFPSDVVSGPSVPISVNIQFANGLVDISKK